MFSYPRFCYCNLEKASHTDEKCTFCGDPNMKFIQQCWAEKRFGADVKWLPGHG